MSKKLVVPAGEFVDATDVHLFDGEGVLSGLTNSTAYDVYECIFRDSLTPMAGVTIAPSFDRMFLYGGSSPTFDRGEWPGSATGVVNLLVSNDGLTGWTVYAANIDAGNNIVYGVPDSGLKDKFIRLQGVAISGYTILGTIHKVGPTFSHTIKNTANSYSEWDLSDAIKNTLFTDGIFMHGKCLIEAGTDNGRPFMAIGTSGTANSLMTIQSRNGWIRAGSAGASDGYTSTPSDIRAQARWRPVTFYVKKTDANNGFVKLWVDDLIGDADTFTFAALTPGALGWDKLRVGSLINQTMGGFPYSDFAFCDLMIGKGDPTALHAFLYNNGKLQSLRDADLVGLGVTPLFWVDGVQEGASPAMSGSSFPDRTGNHGAPTTVATASWYQLAGTRPGYIQPYGPVAPLALGFIGPDTVFAGRRQGFQYGAGLVQSFTWMEALPWTVVEPTIPKGARRTDAGVLYVARVDHSPTTLAADKAAEKLAQFDITAMTHAAFTAGDLRCPAGSVAQGNIIGLLDANKSFICTEPGIITATVTVGVTTSTPADWVANTDYTPGTRAKSGTTWIKCASIHRSGSTAAPDIAAGLWEVIKETRTITAFVYPNDAYPVSPRNKTGWNDNGRVGALQVYAAPVPAGTVFSTVTDLQTAINALTAGQAITVADMNFPTTDLVIPAKTYGAQYSPCGIEFKNLHGGVFRDILLDGVGNFKIMGAKAARGIKGGNTRGGTTYVGCENIWLNQCHANFRSLFSKTRGVGFLRVENFTTDETDVQESQIDSGFAEVIFLRNVVGKPADPSNFDRILSVYASRIVARYFFVHGSAVRIDSAHGDLWQISQMGPNGYVSGIIEDIMMIEAGAAGSYHDQGLFADGQVHFMGFAVRRANIRAGIDKNLHLTVCRQNVQVEDCFVISQINVNPNGRPGAGLVSNCMQWQRSAGPAGNIIERDAHSHQDFGGVSGGYPQMDANPDSWKGWQNRINAVAGFGADAVIDQIAAA